MDMGTPFFHVFPVLKLSQALQDLFGEVFVDRVTASRTRKCVRVHMESRHLIFREDIKCGR